VHTVPEHGLTFGQRISLLTGGPRTATNPANAILNYLYALLEAERILACQQIGLDPGLFHTDQRDRDSLALDIMEAARPTVDGYLLGLDARRTLSASDFGETRSGATRLTAAMAAGLAKTVPVWRDQVVPHVERVAYVLGGSVARVANATPLTRAHHLTAWDECGRQRHQPQRRSVAMLPDSCRDRGGRYRVAATATARRARKLRWATSAQRSRA
jgi:CRISPR-associated protein Cas1